MKPLTQNLPNQNYQVISVSYRLLTVVVFFTAGISWANKFAAHSPFVLLVTLLSPCLVYYAYKRKLHNFIIYLFLGLFFFFLGVQHYQSYEPPSKAPNHIYNLITNKQNVTLDGILAKHPSVIFADSGDTTRLLMLVNSIFYPVKDSMEQASSNVKTSGLILLTLNGPPPVDLYPGERFMAKSKISRVTTYSTPGSFNYKKHLESQSIMVKGWVQSPLDIIKVNTVPSSDFASHLANLKYIPERIRHAIASFLNQTLSQPARGLYKAILIGDRGDIPSTVLENFKSAGCLHILAISGMHMGLIALITITFLIWLLKRSQWLLLHLPVVKVAVSIAFIPLLFYALIAGFNLPVLRSLLMTSVFILSILFDRQKNLLNHIILAAFLILLWKPEAIFSASFQLSFSAVTAIAIIYPTLHNVVSPINFSNVESKEKNSPISNSALFASINVLPVFFFRWLLAAVLLSITAILGTLPLLLFHFNRVSVVAPLTNLLVEPLMCLWSLVIGLLACLFIPFVPSLAEMFFVAGSYGLNLAERICAFFSALPFSSIWLPTPSKFEIMYFYIVILCAVTAIQLKLTRKRHIFMGAVLILMPMIGIPAFSSFAFQASPSATISVLDVGHGSAVLLQLPENKNILIDGGGAGSDRFNIGERIIGPYLWRQRIKKLDAVVISHPHADHYNGLPFILKRFRPKVLWVNGMHGNDPRYRHLIALADQLGIETKIAKLQEVMSAGDDFKLSCLSGGLTQKKYTNHFANNKKFDQNDLSLVLKLEAFNKSFLFPADISSAMANLIVSDKSNVQAEVLLAPHHGSRSSMSLDFINAVDPQYIIISAGRNNPFNFPDKSIYDLQDKGINILSTGQDGTVTLNISKQELTVSRYQVN